MDTGYLQSAQHWSVYEVADSLRYEWKEEMDTDPQQTCSMSSSCVGYREISDTSAVLYYGISTNTLEAQAYRKSDTTLSLTYHPQPLPDGVLSLTLVSQVLYHDSGTVTIADTNGTETVFALGRGVAKHPYLGPAPITVTYSVSSDPSRTEKPIVIDPHFILADTISSPLYNTRAAPWWVILLMVVVPVAAFSGYFIYSIKRKAKDQ